MPCASVCSDTSTFVADDLAQCLFCVMPAIWCAYGARLDVGASEQPTTQRIDWTSCGFPFPTWGKKGVFEKMQSLL